MSFVTALSHSNGQSCDGFACPCKTAALSTSIFTAAQMGDMLTVRQRLLRNTDLVNRCDTYGYTPIHYAAQNGHAGIVEVLLSQGALPDGGTCGATALHRTAYSGHERCCALLLAAGAAVNAQDTSFGDICTPAHKAVLGGHQHLLPLLLSHGADFSILNASGHTVHDLITMDTQQGSQQDPSLARDTNEPAVYCRPSAAPPRAAAAVCSVCGQGGLAFSRSRRTGQLVCSQCRYIIS